VPTASGFARARQTVLEICLAGREPKTLRVDLLAAIGRVVGFDAYAWLLTDAETSVGFSPLADVPCLPELPKLIRLKYLTPTNRWTSLRSPVATLEAATNGDLARSRVWRELLQDCRVVDVASAVYQDRFGCWGFLDLWRTQPSPPFNDAEVDFLATVAGPVTTALRQAQAATFSAPTTQAAAAAAGPVVLLLSPDIQVMAQTPETQEYLRLLLPPDESERPPIPAAAYNVAAQLLALEAGVDRSPPMTRAHLAHGAWLTLRAARIGTDTPAGARDIAVGIEVTSPRDRVTLFGRAFGLTGREAELLRHLATGADTRDLSRLMFVSEHTVQDHLKSIFNKTGIRGRRALLACALGT
jgi:DNA-binding CsgD family transcriptional regulator